MSFTPSGRLRAHQLAEQWRDGSVAVNDVREPMEFVGAHIPGGRNVPRGKLATADLPVTPFVLVCQRGARSQRGLVVLQRRGLSQPLSDLEGGLMAWQQAGLPVEKRRGAPLPLMRQVCRLRLDRWCWLGCCCLSWWRPLGSGSVVSWGLALCLPG